jgi:uncharacterized protein YdaU (DUF1376 family)
MAEFPALPIFTDAFISDTLHLNAAQTGAYFMLLMVAWRTKDCCLPDDDNQLARFARMDKRSWMVNREVILSFWKYNNDGHLIQKRLLDERKHAEVRRDHAIRAGHASALKRKERHSTDAITERQPKGNNPKPNPYPIEKETTNVVSKKNAKSLKSFFGSEDFDIPQDWGDMAYEDGLTADEINWHFTKFKNYWLASSGAKAAKKDWKRTWQNWYMQELERKKRKEELNGLYTKK